MKRLISLLLACLMIISLNIATSAKNVDEVDNNIISKTVEVLEDGTIVETVIFLEDTAISTYSTKSITGSKYITWKSDDGEVLWTFTLKGTFTVNTGVSATCTAATYTTSNIASGWSLYSASTSKSSNKAMADFVFKHKVLFVTTQTVEKSLTLTCDVNGNLS